MAGLWGSVPSAYSSMLNPVQSNIQFTPQMLGIPQYTGEGLPAAFTVRAPTGQMVSGYTPDLAMLGAVGQQIPTNAVNLMNMYLNLEKAGFMQPINQFKGFNFPVAPQAQAQVPIQQTLVPPPQGPTATPAIPLQAYSSMLNPGAGVSTAGLPQQMLNAIPSYLRR